MAAIEGGTVSVGAEGDSEVRIGKVGNATLGSRTVTVKITACADESII